MKRYFSYLNILNRLTLFSLIKREYSLELWTNVLNFILLELKVPLNESITFLVGSNFYRLPFDILGYVQLL